MNESHVVLTLKEYKLMEEQSKSRLEALDRANESKDIISRATVDLVMAIINMPFNGGTTDGTHLANSLCTKADLRIELDMPTGTIRCGEGSKIIKLRPNGK